MDISLLNLPKPLVNNIFDFLWGNIKTYKLILDNSLKILPNNWYIHLRAVNHCKIDGKEYEELEDNIYCSSCGEKTLFFDGLSSICWDCEDESLLYKYLHISWTRKYRIAC